MVVVRVKGPLWSQCCCEARQKGKAGKKVRKEEGGRG